MKFVNGVKAVLLDIHRSVRWTGGTGVAQSPGHNVIVMNELRLLFLLPGAYTPRNCVHGCTQSQDTKEDVS